MKRLTSIVSILLVLCLLIGTLCTVPASASASNAKAIKFNTYYSATWYDDDVLSCYSTFTLSKRGYITLIVDKTMGRSSYADMDFFVYNSSGKLMWTASNSLSHESFYDYYSYKVGLNKGKYFLNIQPKSYSIGYKSSISTRYKVKFTATDYFEIESNNSISTATKILRDTKYTAVYGDESYDSSYIDFFKFSATKGNTYKVAFGNYGDINSSTTIVKILDKSQNEIAYPYHRSYCTFKAAYTGDYYIYLRNCGNKTGFTYSVMVSNTARRLNLTSANVDETKKITLKVLNNSQKVTWKSSNTKVAKVDQKGNVKGIKPGKATVSATVGKTTYQCAVTVKKLMVSSVKLSKTSLSLLPKKTYTLKTAVAPKAVKNKKVKWTTSNKNVAVVNSAGKITAKKPGTAVIKATATDGSKKFASCKVTVFADRVKTIALSKTSLTLEQGKKTTLTATVKPSNAYNKNVKWTSSNTAIATVSQKGGIVAKKPGAVKITATAADGYGAKAACVVTVKAPKTSFEKLRDYIVKNGTTGSDGKPALKYYGKNGDVSSIFYDASTKRFRFYYECGNDFCEMYMSMNGNESIPLEFYRYISYVSHISGTATIIPAEYNSDITAYKPRLQYSYTSGMEGYLNSSAIADLEAAEVDGSQIMISTAMLAWEITLLKSDFSFKALGFKKF